MVWGGLCSSFFLLSGMMQGFLPYVERTSADKSAINTLLGGVARMKESRHTCEWDMRGPLCARICNTLQLTATHCNTLQHTATYCNTLQHTCEWVIRGRKWGDVTDMNASYHTYEWVCHTWMGHGGRKWGEGSLWSGAVLHRLVSHVTCMKESCHTYEWVMPHVWRSHVTRMKESCHTYEGVMSHVWRSHVTRMKEACHTYEGVMSHVWKRHVTHMKKVSFHIHADL